MYEEIKQKNGIAHIHCKAGADRTGMYAYIYKTLNGIGTDSENLKEWIQLGHNMEIYPNLISQTKELLTKFLK